MEYEFDWDTYILYLGTDMKNYYKAIPCNTLEKVQYELNKAELYEKYMVKGISFKRNEENIIIAGRIEPNRKKDVYEEYAKKRSR